MIRRRGDRSPSKQRTKSVPEPTRPINRAQSQEAFDLATRALRDHRYEEAHRNFEAAVRNDPSSHAARVGLAEAAAAMHDMAAARAELDELLDMAPRSAAVALLVGSAWERLGRPSDAARCFASAARLAPDDPDHHLAEARAAEHANDLDRARAALERAASLESRDEIRLLSARLSRRAGDPRAAEAALRPLLESASLPEPIRISALYELATTLDGVGDFDEAFRSLLAAKALQMADPSTAETLDRSRRLMAAHHATCMEWTSVDLDHWAAQPPMHPARRLAVLTGHPRSGTTLLEQVLGGHAGVAAADEATAFADVVSTRLTQGATAGVTALDALRAADRARVAACRKDYWSRMQSYLEEPINQRLLLDKNPELTPHIPMIRRAFPEARIITMLRDPRDICISCFFQQLPTNPVSVHWFDLGRTIDRFVWMARIWKLVRAILPASSWLEVRYEDTVLDLEAAARRTLEFLGLDWDPTVLAFHQSARTHNLGNPSYAAVSQPLYSSAVGRWQHYARWLEPHLDRLAPALESLGYQ